MIRFGRRVGRLARLAVHVLLGLLAAYPLFALLDMIAPRHPHTHRQATAHWWTRGLCAILKLRVRLEGRIHDAPTLFVANHISWLDIICVRAHVDALLVAKEEVRRWPVFGGIFARADTLFLPRGGPSVHVADQMTWHLLAHRSVLVFPEGSSSDGTTVDRFHARLYQAAIRAQCAVQAVAITYPHPAGVHPAAPFVGEAALLPHLWRVLAEPALEVRISLCAPLSATGKERRVLANLTRDQILCALKIKGEQVADGLASARAF